MGVDTMNFFDEYELFHAYYNLDGGKRLFIDKRIDICRFCGKNSSTTKFDKSSHALPESLGNKILFSFGSFSMNFAMIHFNSRNSI